MMCRKVHAEIMVFRYLLFTLCTQNFSQMPFSLFFTVLFHLSFITIPSRLARQKFDDVTRVTKSGCVPQSTFVLHLPHFSFLFLNRKTNFTCMQMTFARIFRLLAIAYFLHDHLCIKEITMDKHCQGHENLDHRFIKYCTYEWIFCEKVFITLF